MKVCAEVSCPSFKFRVQLEYCEVFELVNGSRDRMIWTRKESLDLQ